MRSLQFKTHIGSDGLLQMQMPPGVKDTELEVLVVFDFDLPSFRLIQSSFPMMRAIGA